MNINPKYLVIATQILMPFPDRFLVMTNVRYIKADTTQFSKPQIDFQTVWWPYKCLRK